MLLHFSLGGLKTKHILNGSKIKRSDRQQKHKRYEQLNNNAQIYIKDWGYPMKVASYHQQAVKV